MKGGQLSPALRQTLVAVAEGFSTADDPWWIISSAAVALHGAGPIEVRDVDVLASERDAQRFLHAQGIAAAEGPASTLFRSRVFGEWRANPLPVEIIAAFQIWRIDRWETVRPITREAVDLDGWRLFVPSRGELTAMLKAFARPKDFERAELLEGCVKPFGCDTVIELR